MSDDYWQISGTARPDTPVGIRLFDRKTKVTWVLVYFPISAILHMRHCDSSFFSWLPRDVVYYMCDFLTDIKYFTRHIY